MSTTSRKRKQGRSVPTSAQQIAQLRGEVAQLRSLISQFKEGPPLPPPDADGYYPATETLRAILARQIARRRHGVGWTQGELARRAGVRQETISRIESGKHAPNVRTVDKLDRVLKEAGV